MGQDFVELCLDGTDEIGWEAAAQRRDDPSRRIGHAQPGGHETAERRQKQGAGEGREHETERQLGRQTHHVVALKLADVCPGQRDQVHLQACR